MTSPLTPPPAGPWPGGAPPPAKVRPGRVWYLVGALLVIGGIAWIVFGLVSLSSQINAFQRVPLPAGGQISLTRSGGYVVYYEGPGAESGNVPAVQFRVIPASPSASVTSLTTYRSQITYSMGSHQGRAELSMHVAHPGKFQVRIDGAPTVPNGSYLAFGDSIAGGIAGTVVISIVVILAGVALVIVMAIVRHSRRKRARMATPI